MIAVEIIGNVEGEIVLEPGVRVGRAGDPCITDLPRCAASPDERRALLGQLLLAAASTGVGPGAI